MSAAPQRERFDRAKLRRGLRERFETRTKPRVFEGRPAQTPQRVAGKLKIAKKTRVLEEREALQKQFQWLGHDFELALRTLWSKSHWLGNGLRFAASRK